MAASTTRMGDRRAEREPAVKLRKGSPDAQFMDPKAPRQATDLPGGLMVVATVEAPQQDSLVTRTRSVAVIVQAPASVAYVVPPAEFDEQIEEPMDYSPLTTVAALDHPVEEWPEGSGPFGF